MNYSNSVRFLNIVINISDLQKKYLPLTFHKNSYTVGPTDSIMIATSYDSLPLLLFIFTLFKVYPLTLSSLVPLSLSHISVPLFAM